MENKTITVVGSQETVDFPTLGLFSVPAKIDTGADSSAIWASDVHEEDGTLSFVLFDKVSPFYTGEVLKTKKFSVSSIKNSFGQLEFRYKVALKVNFGGRSLRVRFTLANRENNRLPILIGRRTLHGKFLVDVSQINEKQTVQRLLLVSVKRTDTVESFITAIKEQSDGRLDVTYVTYDEITFLFTREATKIVITETGEDIASYDIVHFKTWKERDVTAAMAAYLQKRGVLFFDKRAVHFSANSKLYQYVVLSDHGVAVPPSVFVMPSQYESSFQSFADTLGLPFVFKGTQASRGAYNYLIKDKATYDIAVKSILENGIMAVAQQFIPNDGDYRILVLGRHLALAIRRSRQNGDATHLNNTSQGGHASLEAVKTLPTAVRQDSMTAAMVLELGIAGVDMLKDKQSGAWYCLEVNGDPQMASGSFVAEKQAAYAEYIATELSK